VIALSTVVDDLSDLHREVIAGSAVISWLVIGDGFCSSDDLVAG
jgi:hypothetical protein